MSASSRPRGGAFGSTREYFWKFTDGAYDFDIILNTPLAFPVQFRQSRQDGGLVRITVPEYHGWQLYTTLSHTRSRLFGPELGGLRFSADYAPVARPDHDEPFQQNTHLEYRSDSGTRILGRPDVAVRQRVGRGRRADL